MNRWLLLVYKVPNEPSAKRVYVWRKLKGMGAILLQDSVWVLPANDRTREKMQWLASEIKEMPDGIATLWDAQEVFTGQDANLVQQFMAQVEAVYTQILAQVERDEADLPALSKQYQQVRSQDYFDSPVGERVRQALLRRREGTQE